ncbi:MAG: TolC family outer membrane protein [Betaproteobacteria bacterium]|nr:TolC family outer membrane protein [Betaproteobacteria bacterium]
MLAGLCAALLLPLPARGETLLEAYRLAVENDPKYRAARAESLAAGTAIDQARAGFLPQVRFDLERTETRQRILKSENPIFGAGITNFPTDNETLSVNQPIFRKDVIERFAQAKAVVRQAEFTLLAAEQDLLLRTAAAYLVVLAATDSQALARAEREAVGKALDLAREKLAIGLGTIVNQHDAAARYAVTQARELEAQYRLHDARQGLREITGRLIEKVQRLREEFTLETPEPARVDRWLASASEQNLVLRAKREAVEVARQEVERQRAGHFPSLNLVLNHNRRDAGSTLFGGGSEVETTDLTLRLSVPIFEGGLTSAVTQEAAHRYQKSREELEQERRAVERATRAAFEGTLVGVSLVRALRQSVISQQSALEAKEEGHRSGLFTLLPVLDAQRDLYLAKRDFAQSRYEYLLTRLRLKQAAGMLSEADLVSLGAALQ